MRELYISQVGLGPSDVQRLKAVMVIIVSNRDVTARWCMGEPNAAELVLVSPDSEETRQFLAQRSRNSRQVVAAVVGESDTVTFECERLAWPIRLPNLLELLKRVELLTQDSDPTGSAVHRQAPADHPLVQLAGLIRGPTLGDKLAWCVAGLSERPVYVAPHLNAFFCKDSLLRLVLGEANTKLEIQPIPVEKLPREETRKPMRMLQWSIGLRIGTMGLIPWIKSDSIFQLKQFPEFQILHHSIEHRRTAAALSRARAGVQAICDVTDVDPRTVIGFINAASLCGYLRVSESGPVKTAAKKIAVGSRRGLFEGFRRALGIATRDA